MTLTAVMGGNSSLAYSKSARISPSPGVLQIGRHRCVRVAMSSKALGMCLELVRISEAHSQNNWSHAMQKSLLEALVNAQPDRCHRTACTVSLSVDCALALREELVFQLNLKQRRIRSIIANPLLKELRRATAQGLKQLA